MVDYNSSWDIWGDNRLYGATPRHTRRMIKALLAGIEFDTVLDVGCGNGSFLRFVKKISGKPEEKLAGIDLSEKALSISRKYMPKVFLKAFDIERGYLDKRFDLVLCNDVLEHLDNDIQALKNIRQMSNRYFICNTIQGKMYKSEKLLGHRRSYKKEELLKRLEDARFRPLKVIEWGFPFYNLCRRLTRGSVQKAIYGRYGFFKKIASHIIYILFMLNSKNKGDIIIVLSEIKD